MIILRLPLVSALIYVGLALAVEVGLMVLSRIYGVTSLFASRPGWFAFFGVFWFISFWIAFRFSPLFKHGLR
jgi:hypothetical protein